MTKIKILFIYDEMRTFVKNDLDILKDHFHVKTLKYTNKKDIPRLIWGVITTDVSFSWFALGYATTAVFFSRVFGKKSIVVAGGWDVVSMPEMGYGAMQSPKRIRKTRFTLKHADKVLAVSNSTKSNVLYWWDKTNVETVYLGFDYTKYRSLAKKDLVINVSTSSWQLLRVNGIETFVKSANFLPEATFLLIGPQLDDSIDYLKSIAPSNVIFKGYTPPEELSIHFGHAKVYAQLSAQESFGCALAEAMLCECVPVVTNCASLPEVVGKTGFYVNYGETEQTAQKIKEALYSNNSPKARERIKTLYPIEKREKRILEIIEEISCK